MGIYIDDIKKVLAMFDEEDIPYINFEYLFNFIPKGDGKNNNNRKLKIKKLGDKNGKRRK